MMGYQIHRHTQLNSRLSPAPEVIHAHEGGEQPHQHPGHGPACYEGTYKFSAKPKGQQLPWKDLEEWQRSFVVVVCAPVPKKGEPGYIGEGPGTLPAERMVHDFKMRISKVIDGR